MLALYLVIKLGFCIGLLFSLRYPAGQMRWVELLVKRKLLIPYVLLAVLVTLILELVSILFGVFHYINWSIVFSAISYTLIYISNILFLRLIEHLVSKETSKQKDWIL
ncbi:hypothetical protein ACFO3D_08485 [Virgibacillus kekensis]|uniref:Uncharacterized protein n=1 Tax=Virgibacillus kekensis TaxID=202261 RepID=A0ABV9DIU6_9BACI